MEAASLPHVAHTEKAEKRKGSTPKRRFPIPFSSFASALQLQHVEKSQADKPNKCGVAFVVKVPQYTHAHTHTHAPSNTLLHKHTHTHSFCLCVVGVVCLERKTT